MTLNSLAGFYAQFQKQKKVLKFNWEKKYLLLIIVFLQFVYNSEDQQECGMFHYLKVFFSATVIFQFFFPP